MGQDGERHSEAATSISAYPGHGECSHSSLASHPSKRCQTTLFVNAAPLHSRVGCCRWPHQILKNLFKPELTSTEKLNDSEHFVFTFDHVTFDKK